MPHDAAPAGSPRGWWVFSRPNDDPGKILAVAITLCLVCAVLVASAAVMLKPRQERNQALAVRKEIVRVAGFQADNAREVEQLFRQHIETRIVNLDTGDYAEGIDPATFDERAEARNPATSHALASGKDPARIKRRPDNAPVYLAKDNGRIKSIILPVYGYGLWSTLYGFLALADDARTITAITFYEHGETPGLGDFIESPAWQSQFPGKLAYDKSGRVQLRVVKGGVNPASPDAKYEVDGVAGATLTSRGVNNLLRYWLGDQGFGPYLKRLQSHGDKA
jgi:Na+-transporting NADH:ubiquinone oxidoreductase subunit C